MIYKLHVHHTVSSAELARFSNGFKLIELLQRVYSDANDLQNVCGRITSDASYKITNLPPNLIGQAGYIFDFASVPSRHLQLFFGDSLYFRSWFSDTGYTPWIKLAKTNEILPISGGIMTNSNGFNYTQITTNDNGGLVLRGGTGYRKGALLALFGKDNTNAGRFMLSADNGTNSVDLIGQADASLIWAGNDLGGAAIVSKSIAYNGYIKYANGLILQWGGDYSSPASKKVINYPISFPIAVYGACAIIDVGESEVVVSTAFAGIGTSGFTCIKSSTHGGIRWIAIGY